MSSDLLNASLAYIENGWHVLPLHWIEGGACSCGHSDCDSPGKHPLTRSGVHDAANDPDTIRYWWGTRWPSANIGISTGVKSELFVVDIDTEKGGDYSLDVIEEALPDTAVVITGSGGFHYYYGHPGDDFRVRNAVRLQGLPGIDIRGDGGYVVAPPSTHQSGRQYEWEASGDALAGHNVAPCPIGFAHQFDLIREPHASVSIEELIQQLTPDEVHRISDALRCLSADCGREEWLRVGMALHSTGASQQAYELWRDWSATSTKYNQRDLDKAWFSFRSKDRMVNLESLFHMATEAGWQYTPLEQVKFVDDRPSSPMAGSSFEPSAAHDPIEYTAQVGAKETIQGEVTDAAKSAPTQLPEHRSPSTKQVQSDGGIPTYRATEAIALAREQPEEIWWGSRYSLFPGALVFIAGQPKVGKTQFIFDLVVQAALGGSFLDYKIHRPLRTVYFQGEIRKKFIPDRLPIDDLSDEELERLDENLMITERCQLDLTKPNASNWRMAADLIHEHRADLAVFDPLINFTLAEENNNTEMGAFTKSLTQLSQACGNAAIALVHHVRKGSFGEDAFDRIRGASALRGWYDTAFVLEKLEVEPPEQPKILISYDLRNDRSPQPHEARIDMAATKRVIPLRQETTFIDDRVGASKETQVAEYLASKASKCPADQHSKLHRAFLQECPDLGWISKRKLLGLCTRGSRRGLKMSESSAERLLPDLHRVDLFIEVRGGQRNREFRPRSDEEIAEILQGTTTTESAGESEGDVN